MVPFRMDFTFAVEIPISHLRINVQWVSFKINEDYAFFSFVSVFTFNVMIAAGKRESFQRQLQLQKKGVGSQSRNDADSFHFRMPGQGSEICLNKSCCIPP